MKKSLLSLLLVVPWLLLSAQDTTLTLGYETQEEFESNWTQIGSEAQWSWLNYEAGATSIVPVAQLEVVEPIPEKGTILAYKESIGMKAGAGSARVNNRCSDYSSAKVFEILIASDNQFNNIVATVKGYSKGRTFGMSPLGNQYQPDSFTLNADGFYYVGFRTIQEYDGEITVEGTWMVNHLELKFNKYEAPAPSACTNVEVVSQSTDTSLAAALSWTWPTTDTNGGSLSQVGAYIYRSTAEVDIVSPSNLIHTVQCATQESTGIYVDENISEPGTYYYAVVPFNTNSVSSVTPQVVSAKIDFIDLSAPINLDEPYTNAFAAETDLNGFFSEKTESLRWQWNAGSGYMYLNGDGNSATVDKLFTPAFAMVEGVQYRVSFDAWAGSGNANAMKLLIGNSRENLTEVGEAVPVTANSMDAPQRVEFIVTGNADGKMYLAIEGTAASRATLYMNNLCVEKYVAATPTLTITEVDATNINPESFDLHILYTSENIPEDAVIFAVVSEESWTESQAYEIDENPATITVTGLSEDMDYVFHITLQMNVGDDVISSNTEELVIKTTGVTNVAADIANGARYFNLKGIEVQKPGTGIYIRIMNGIAKKVFIKEMR